MVKYSAARTPGPKEGLRQTGQFELHPDGCECRKCRRRRVAQARRNKPRYGLARDSKD